MSKPFRFGSAVSVAVLASMIAGCAAPEKLGLGGRTDGNVGLATKAAIALNSNDYPAAINFAERAVESSPDDAGFRALLGNAYFGAGRFHSAETAYKDALTIYSNQPQVVIKLALAQIAQGKNDQAVEFLDAARSALDPANYGLALALAGLPTDAIAILEPAARQPGADSRVRQNLALAYALSGDWTNARTIAAQDVPANQLDSRIHQWMLLAKPTKASDQVAALTGVKPAASDQGEPVRLALRQTDTRLAAVEAPAAAAPEPAPQVAPQLVAEPAPIQAAAAQPNSASTAPVQAAQPAPVEVAVVDPAAPAPRPEVERAVAEAAAPVSAPMAMIEAAARTVASAVETVVPKAIPAPRPSRIRHVAAPAIAHRGNSNAVMQLGSYRSPEQVTAGWNVLTRRYPALRAYLPMRARFDSPNGVYWRLSIQGFESQREAIERCSVLQSRGGKCFVRGFAGDRPVEIASR